MKSYVDCYACFVRQTIDSCRGVHASEEKTYKILQDILRFLSQMDPETPPPKVAQLIHRKIRDNLGKKDPYKEKKIYSIRMALKLTPFLDEVIKNAAGPFEAALKLAIVGNVLDLGAFSEVVADDVEKSIHQVLSTHFHGDIDYFRRTIEKAENILYLADNSGELVFDRLLLSMLPLEKTTVAVRGYPVINDATLAESTYIRLPGLVPVIDNGSDAPGTILEDCKPEFQKAFQNADVIIAKGQGNFESLNTENRLLAGKEIFFLFKVKCQTIARIAGFPVGYHLLLSGVPDNTQDLYNS